MVKTKYFIVLLTLLLVVAGVAGCGKKQNIRYDGIYSNQSDVHKVHIYFRFYADGTVTAALPVPVNNEYTLKMSALDKDNLKECTIRGKYLLHKNKVEFKLVDKNGSADFSGEFQADKVILKSHSNINGKDALDTYEFYKFK